jgi:oligoribonuclease (3'-5' exoribonuclease)
MLIRVAILCSIMVGVAWAHPPSGIDLKFDVGSSLLSVRIEHQVKDMTTHFIAKAVVMLNGKEIVVQKMSRQMNNVEQGLIYKIVDAKPGDEIAVSATCSISGKKKASIKVAGSKE